MIPVWGLAAYGLLTALGWGLAWYWWRKEKRLRWKYGLVRFSNEVLSHDNEELKRQYATKVGPLAGLLEIKVPAEMWEYKAPTGEGGK